MQDAFNNRNATARVKRRVMPDESEIGQHETHKHPVHGRRSLSLVLIGCRPRPGKLLHANCSPSALPVPFPFPFRFLFLLLLREPFSVAIADGPSITGRSTIQLLRTFNQGKTQPTKSPKFAHEDAEPHAGSSYRALRLLRRSTKNLALLVDDHKGLARRPPLAFVVIRTRRLLRIRPER